MLALQLILGTASTWHRSGSPQRPRGFVSIGSSPLTWWLLAFVISLSIVLGGGTRQGAWSDALVQLASLSLLAVVSPSFFSSESKFRVDLLALVLLAAMVALPSIQLIPLPAAIWTRLPGRGEVAVAYLAAGIDPPWLPVSLDPERTLRSALSLLPGIAVFLATLGLDLSARRSLSLLYVGLASVSVLLGLAQLAQGPESALRFFPITNPSESVGFFANRNHYAALLSSLMPVVAAWVVGLVFDRRSERLVGLVICVLLFATLMLGLGMARSRAGIFLAVLAGAGGLGLAAVSGRRLARYGTAIITGAWLFGLVLIIQYALYRLLSRLDSDILADLRFDIAGVTIDAASAFQPFGSGLGTFQAIYQTFEPNELLLTPYVNHAHNDWLELWLEGGWPAVFLMLVFLFWFIRASFRAWRAPMHEGHALDRSLRQAATITISVLLFHSAVDYPLRTTTLLTLFGWSCALLLGPYQLSSGGRAEAMPTDDDGRRPRRTKKRVWWKNRSRHRANAWHR